MDIVLENCEVYSFDEKDTAVYFDGFSRHIFSGKNYDSVKHTCLILPKSAQAKAFHDISDDWQKRIPKDGGDIVTIDFGEQRYWVDWDDKNEYSNRYQQVIEDDDRYIIIISKTRHTLEDFA